MEVNSELKILIPQVIVKETNNYMLTIVECDKRILQCRIDDNDQNLILNSKDIPGNFTIAFSIENKLSPSVKRTFPFNI